MTGPEPRDNYVNGDEISLKDWLAILLDEWKALTVPVVLVVAAAVAYLLLAIPSYQAEGILQVTTDGGGGSDALLELSGMTPVSPTESEVEILRSQRIISAAARRLNLNITAPLPSLTADLRVSQGGRSPLPPDLIRLRRAVSQLQVEDWVEGPVPTVFQETADGRLAVTMNGRTERVKPGGIFSRRGISFMYRGNAAADRIGTIETSIIPDDQLASLLRDRLTVKTIGDRKETNLVKVSFVHQDRTLAKAFVNAVMDAYMAFALDWRTDRAEKSARFIEKQMDSLRVSLEGTEDQLQTFLEQSGAVMLSDQAKVLIEEGSQMNLELQKLRIQEDMMKKASFQLQDSRGKGDAVALTGDFIFEDQLLGQAISTMNELQLKKETLLADFTPQHPRIVRISEEISRVRNQIEEYVRSSRLRINQRRESIDTALSAIQEDLAQFPEKERTLATLRRNQEVGQQLYTFLLTKLEESRIVKASTTTDKRIIDTATTPFERATPRRRPILLIALLVGLMAGALTVFVKRALDPKVQDEEEAKTITQLPVHGVIPNLKLLGFSTDRPVIEQIWEVPKGPAAESFRTLRTNVEFSQTPEHPIRVIQITSSEASEGKSTVISNLAISLAKAGNRVVLADLDLRRPTQHRVWQVPRSPGMSDFLSGRAKLSVQHLEKWGVDVVSAGYEPPESQRLLASSTLANLVEEWRRKYDYVLLDTSPLLVADALVISKISDMMIFVVRPRACRRAAVQLAGGTYARMNLVKGLVINGTTSRKGGYYHYYRGSYYGSKTTDTQES